MTTPDTELMHRVLDGEASPEERVRFEQMLERDVESREAFGELQAALDHVSRLPQIEPTEGFADRIIAALPEDVAERRRARTAERRAPSLFQRIAGLFRGRKRPMLALAYAFSIGLLAGVGLYSVFAPAPTAVTGTFAAEAVREIEVDGFRGRVQVATDRDVLRLRMELEAQTPADVAVRFGDGLDLESFEQRGGSPEITTKDNVLTTRVDGRTEIDLAFTREEQIDLVVDVARDGAVLESETFH